MAGLSPKGKFLKVTKADIKEIFIYEISESVDSVIFDTYILLKSSELFTIKEVEVPNNGNFAGIIAINLMEKTKEKELFLHQVKNAVKKGNITALEYKPNYK